MCNSNTQDFNAGWLKQVLGQFGLCSNLQASLDCRKDPILNTQTDKQPSQQHKCINPALSPTFNLV